MIRYFIKRPVAVFMFFLGLTIAGLVSIKKIPVSLLPNIDVPQIVIHINYSNTSAAVLEENVIRRIRESLTNLNQLKNIESKSSNHTGIVYLTFDYGTKMDLAYIEVNEKLDRLASFLPRDMQRPQVMRINTSDIPVLRLQIIPKTNDDFIKVSELTEKILKKRIEQIDGVSLVDINGKQQSIINIIPNKEALHSLGTSEDLIVQTIKNANQGLNGLSLKDGHLRYIVKLSNPIESVAQLSELPIKLKDGNIIALKRVAALIATEEKPNGYHLLNGKIGLVITVQKQSNSKMNELVPQLKKAIVQFKKDYPDINFYTTQDQTFLLDAGIGNLYQDILIGGILTIALLFMFLGNWATPILMSISIPLSLIFTFIFFYVFGISFNIISLSGLALGIGMLIDNSIVVIDNITRKRNAGLNALESSVQGTSEVISPVISQVLTTVAIYAPLIILNGMASSLVADQSIALTISLGVSLLVAFVLSPLLYKLLLHHFPDKLKEDTIFYRWVAKWYHKMITHILKHKLRYFLITVAIMPLGFLIAFQIPISALPKIEKKQSLITIDWNAPIDAQENLRRVQELQKIIQYNCEVTEAEVGIQQFLIQQDNNNIQNTNIYYACKNESLKWATDQKIKNIIKLKYPGAMLQIIDAPNAFTQLFTNNMPYLEARFKSIDHPNNIDIIYHRLENITKKLERSYEPGAGLATQKNVEISLDYNKMAIYGISRSSIEDALQRLYGNYSISEIKRFGEIKTIYLKSANDNETKLNTMIVSENGEQYPLKTFLTMSYALQPRFITADRSGVYHSLIFEKGGNISDLQKRITYLAGINHLSVEFNGKYLEDSSQIKQLWLIFLIVLFLLYIILAIQYEDLIQPLIVMLTIPLGITGSMFLLWITGGTLDAMACIGFIVILGLIVDDPTLKIEVLNRLEKEYKVKGYKKDAALLEKMIHEAGDLCLKPLLMVSLTTSIAMVPVLFVGGIGNELQKPLAYVIIGGLTIGTFFTTWFIPLAYWYVSILKDRIRGQKKENL